MCFVSEELKIKKLINSMNFKIVNNSSNNLDLNDLVQSLGGFAQKRFGFKRPPSVHFTSDSHNASLPLGKTAFYDPNNLEIHIFVDGRHPKDILRSIAHELVHHTQNEQGSLVNNGYAGEGYAQKNPHLRDMEKDAYERGNMCFRDWEDNYKQKNPTIYTERRNKMSLKEWKNKELGQQLMNRWGFKMNLDGLTEESGLLKENMGAMPLSLEPLDPLDLETEEEEEYSCSAEEEPIMDLGSLPMDLEDRVYNKIMEMFGNKK